MTLKKLQYDVVVVGSGGAGSAAAETAASQGLRVLVISKDPIVCSDSKISEGIITVRASETESDTESELANNLRIQGDDISDTDIAKAFAQDSRLAYNWLQKFGIQANINKETGQPKPLSIPMGGHTLARSVDHQNSGLDYGHACWSAMHAGGIDYLEDAWFLDLYTHTDTSSQSHILGGLVYHATEGEFVSVQAPSVILACGGLSTLYYPNTDTMRGNTGDAYAIALRAGAKLVDMEQVQFIPFAVANSPSYQGLIVGEPIIAGVLGSIKDRDGEVLLSEVMGRTRAECSAAIARAVVEGRGTENGACYLDLTDNSKGKSGQAYVALMQEKIPSLLKIVKGAMGQKAALFQEQWEVRPSAHYLMGGIKATAQCEVLDHSDRVINGLFTAGQAMGGLHGSNRLGSTSLAEGIIFGRRAGSSASQHAKAEGKVDSVSLYKIEENVLNVYQSKLTQSESDKANQAAPIQLERKLQKCAWEGLGPARSKDSITNTITEIESIKLSLNALSLEDDLIWNQDFIDYIECSNLLLCAEAVAKSALSRTDSLGAHVRVDEQKSFSIGLRNTGPFSLEVALSKNGMSTTKANRERSSRLTRLKLRAKEKGKILAFKTIKKLPLKQRDEILFKLYNKALSEKLDLEDLTANLETPA